MQKTKKFTLISLIIVTPLGFATKFYNGIFAEWVNNSLGGVFYEIFWCLIFLFIFVRLKPILISIFVFLITSVLEFTQLFSNPFLNVIRSNFIGRTIIGSSFVWSDFVYYFFGCTIAYFWIILFLKSDK
ncbi:MAG: DUF2809 domain-containing protein [Candidatus Cloacimonadota bacterium]|nr:DUF2809 domain-containing protein [Candidatus Cloacimonadota bacterium]